MKTQLSQTEKFSDQLEHWMEGKQSKTLYSLLAISEDKSFAIAYLILMIVPALPLPTGGVTHVFEIATALIAVQQIIGRKTIWLPGWLSKRTKLTALTRGKAKTNILRYIRWFERKSSPRWKRLLELPLAPQLTGLLILAFTATAFFSPPFSGLDTLPSLGVVLLSLARIFDDAVFLFVGIIIGVAGVIISIFFSEAVIRFIHHHL